MSKPNVDGLEDLIKRAAEIAKLVPENLQQAAFNRAVDLLTGPGHPDIQLQPSQLVKHTIRKRDPKIEPSMGSGSPAHNLLRAIDSTQHPEVASANNVLTRSLLVLQIALTNHETDGLTPADIATILTNKFRCATTSDAVRMALGSSVTLVNRVPRSKGKGYVYKIMEPGQQYLANPAKSNAKQIAAAPIVRRTKISCPPPTKEVLVQPHDDSKPTAKSHTQDSAHIKRKSTSSKSGGPKGAILALIESGYFDNPRTVQEIKLYLKEKRGFTIDISQLRVALLRLVRDVVLERGENAERNYEYHRPKAKS